jgi:hypothetical protein
MALNILTELDITSTGDSVYTGFETCQTNHALLDDLFHGYCRRSKFRWKDANEIYIGSGVYFHEGTSNQTLYWNSELTFQLGSAGSNSASDDLGASEWHYIYLDDSAIVTAATNLITNSEILNDTTAPTWSASKHGWYNGNDRCIFAVLTDGSNNVLEFFHAGSRKVFYADAKGDYSNADPGTDYSTEVTLTIPAFSGKATCLFALFYVDGAPGFGYWRHPDDATGGPVIGSVAAGTTLCFNTTDVCCDSNLKINIAVSAASDTMSVTTQGFYLPEGM